MVSTLFNTNTLDSHQSLESKSTFILSKKEKRNEIVFGMSANEISTVVSERIMEIIRKQFDSNQVVSKKKVKK